MSIEAALNLKLRSKIFEYVKCNLEDNECMSLEEKAELILKMKYRINTLDIRQIAEWIGLDLIKFIDLEEKKGE